MTRSRLRVAAAIAGLLTLPSTAAADVVTSSAPGRVAFDLSSGGRLFDVEVVEALRDGSTLAAVRGTGGERLLRIRADGTLDRAYGRAMTARAGKGEIVGLSAGESGRVLLVSDPEGAAAPRVRRFTRRGRLDTGFGQAGRVVLRRLRSVYTFDRTDDGGLLFGGRARRITADTREALVRLTGSGRVDTRFGAGGVRPLRGRRGIREVAARKDDTIMQVVPSILGGPGRKTLTRMTPGGRIEPFAALYPYDRDGSLRVPGRLREIELITIDSQDRVLVLAWHANLDRYLLRLRPDGTLDSSFGTGGHVRLTDFSPIHAFKVLDDDGVLFASSDGISVPGADVQTLRLTADGDVARRTTTPLPIGGGDENSIDTLKPDGSFETEYLTMAPLGGNLDVTDTAVHRDGSVMLGGSVALEHYGEEIRLSTYAALLVAVERDGQLAPGFGRAMPLELGVTAPAQAHSREGLRVRFRPQRQGTARVQVLRDATVVAERMVHFRRGRRAIELRIPWTQAGLALAAEPGDVRLRVEVEANDIPGNRVTRTVETTVR